MKEKIHLSVVSHGQGEMVGLLLEDLKGSIESDDIVVTLTLNVEEILPFDPEGFPFPVRVVSNLIPKGFGANHNAAFNKFQEDAAYFCVVNPDIRLNNNPFQKLLACLKDPTVGVVAPLVLGASGEIEDSARRFPSPLRILCKVFGGCKGSDYAATDVPIHPDWVGGMFMLFPRGIFERLGGFDQRYFLYYEDVDMCARLRLMGYEVAACPRAMVIHHAQRSSHRSFRYLRWHLGSMIRFFLSPVYWRLQFRK